MLKCDFFSKCGGCQYLNLGYEKSCEIKEKEIKNLFPDFSCEPIITMDNPLHYRHKVYATFQKSKKGVILGTYAEKTHQVLETNSCLIQHEEANNILKTIKMLANKMRLSAYDEDRHIGLLRHVYLRVSHYYDEILVVIVVGNHVFPGRNNFVKALKKAHPNIKSVVMNINKRNTSVVLGEIERNLSGPGFIKDKLLGNTFQISSKSFYQVNPIQTEKLYQKALDLAQLKDSDLVLDAYCGIGTITLCAARYAKEVIGVELNKQAIIDAKENQKLNKIKNVKFICADATKFILDCKNKIDVLIMDPPRAGSTKEFINAINKLKPRKVVYISCNPETQVRDLKWFSKDYKVEKVIPVDLFPFTKHVETVVLMSRVDK